MYQNKMILYTCILMGECGGGHTFEAGALNGDYTVAHNKDINLIGQNAFLW